MAKKPPQKPQIVIVDDAPDSIGHLVEMLSNIGCSVAVRTSTQEAEEYFKDNIVTVALLDVNLNHENKYDKQGISLAERMTQSSEREKALAPEASIIFISRQAVLAQDIQLILDMFNMRIGLDHRRRRLAEACAEKEHGETVLKFVKVVLQDKGWFLNKQAVKFLAADIFWTNLDKQISAKLGDLKPEPKIQLLEILRALCVSELGTTKVVSISGVSRGRSRTIVLRVECIYQGDHSEFRIVKVGAQPTIEMEVRNYKENVPSLISGGNYPNMVGYAASRTLAGICYSEFTGGTSLPGSLADKFWDMDTKQILNILDEIYHDTIVDAAGPRPANFNSFFNIYSERLRSLKFKHELHERAKNILRKCQYIKQKDDKFISVNEVIGNSPDLVHPCHGLLEKLPQWNSTGYYEAVVHGDLHPDNILLASDTPVLIDFAHTNLHHASLDYLVMEAMMRSQLLRYLFERNLLQNKDASHLRNMFITWLRIETLLGRDDYSEIANICANANEGKEFQKLANIIQWLRTSAFRKSFLESPKFYYAGLGTIFYSFLGLPDDSKCKDYIREVLLYASSISLTRAFEGNAMKPLIRKDMKVEQLDAALAECSTTWRGWIVKKCRGPLIQFVKFKLADQIEPTILNNQADAILDEVKRLLPNFHDSVLKIAGQIKVDEKTIREMNLDAVGTLIVVDGFFNYALDAGMKWGTFRAIAAPFRIKVRTLWNSTGNKSESPVDSPS